MSAYVRNSLFHCRMSEAALAIAQGELQEGLETLLLLMHAYLCCVLVGLIIVISTQLSSTYPFQSWLIQSKGEAATNQTFSAPELTSENRFSGLAFKLA